MSEIRWLAHRQGRLSWAAWDHKYVGGNRPATGGTNGGLGCAAGSRDPRPCAAGQRTPSV